MPWRGECGLGGGAYLPGAPALRVENGRLIAHTGGEVRKYGPSIDAVSQRMNKTAAL